MRQTFRAAINEVQTFLANHGLRRMLQWQAGHLTPIQLRKTVPIVAPSITTSIPTPIADTRPRNRRVFRLVRQTVNRQGQSSPGLNISGFTPYGLKKGKPFK
jgi:hypothetical protein